jgi:hypothetical protein
VQFLIWSLLVIWFGPTIMHSARHVIHEHSNILLGLGGAALLALGIFVVRRIFDRRKGYRCPSKNRRHPERNERPRIERGLCLAQSCWR